MGISFFGMMMMMMMKETLLLLFDKQGRKNNARPPLPFIDEFLKNIIYE